MPLPAAVTLNAFGSGPNGKQLLLMEPHSVISKPQSLLMRGARVEGLSGAGYAETAPVLPNARWEFQYVCATRAEYAALRDFFDDQMGRYGGFFFPTWQWELMVGPYVPPGTGISVPASAGYADLWFPLGNAYRFLAMLYRDAASIYRVTGVGGGSPPVGYDTLTFGASQHVNGGNSATAPWLESTGVRPLWLRYGRFDTDDFEPENDVNGEGAAIVTLPIVELPEEANTWA